MYGGCGNPDAVERRSILVGLARSTVSPFCTQLTTLTQTDVDAGIPFTEACRLLSQDYRSGQRLWASYGDYDRQQFEATALMYGIPYPFGPGHVNVKTLAAVTHGWTREPGLSEALCRPNLPLEGTHHRGGDDAWNIAGLRARRWGGCEGRQTLPSASPRCALKHHAIAVDILEGQTCYVPVGIEGRDGLVTCGYYAFHGPLPGIGVGEVEYEQILPGSVLGRQVCRVYG